VKKAWTLVVKVVKGTTSALEEVVAVDLALPTQFPQKKGMHVFCAQLDPIAAWD
jgi:hypothetical protein